MASLPKIWNDATCFILGGGPSLNKVDVSLLQDKRVIAVNAAFHIAPWADACWFGDGRFIDWNLWDLCKFPGLKLTCVTRKKLPPDFIQVTRSAQMFGIDQDKSRVAWNRNSGGSAPNVAYHLGARRIVLCGFDMRMVEGKHNWHTYHKTQAPDNVYEKRFLECWIHVKRACDALGVEIVNTSEGSAIDCIDYKPFEETLSW